ncbi:ATP-binding protein [Sphingomonas lenta]|uniref:ATP-binding protein n=1 Tax=Sphingomonas lenta TaxID=1141887 RepID=UPI00159636B6|nr:ATP-binding protein [Sphingomonas lenta]
MQATTPEDLLPAELKRTVAQWRATVLVNPRMALRMGTAAHQQAETISGLRRRKYGHATALWLQSEALLQLGELARARQLIWRGELLVGKVAPTSQLAGDIQLVSGGIYAANADVASALRAYQLAHRTFQKTGNRRSESISLIYISNLYSDGKDHEAALKYLEQALEVYSADPKLLPSIYNNQGTSLYALGRNREAVKQFAKARTLARRLNFSVLESQTLRNILRAQLDDGQIAMAQITAREALLAARHAGGSEEPAMLSVIAQLEFQRGRLQRALSLIEQSFAGVDLTKSTMPMREAHATAHRIHRAVGNAPEALAHLEALKRLDDEATKLATQTSTALMGARFDFANQELRIARMRAEQLQRTIRDEREEAQFRLWIFGMATAASLVVFVLLSVALFTIRRSRNQVRAAHDDLAVTNGALGEALAAKTEFLATTSHEIRTPLNGILGMTEVMLLDRALPDAARERVRLVHGAGKTMKALIDDILDVAKIERGRLSLESVPFRLADVLGDAALLWEDQIRTKGVAFESGFDLPEAQVLGDPARLRQIVFNLLSNAVKFTESGAIRFSASIDEDGAYRIQVADTGVGIATDKLDQVFESFRQADASVTRRFGGTGLGLSISRSLARAMGGELSVSSCPGAGSIFTLTVPLADHVEEVVKAEQSRGSAVLIADRNPIMRAMFRSLLSPHADTIIAVGAAEEALLAIEAHAPGRILIDENMLADEAGREIVREGRRRGAAVTLLEAPGVSVYRGDDVITLQKPVPGPVLVATVFSSGGNLSYTAPLVSRAA